ncbi:TonB-dependent receptor, partial [Escherichia marmotae]|nr:TonB-dependent receptor [Escherichia marmotae]
EVRVAGDTREAAKRRDEIYAMIRGAIGLARQYDVELATGEYVVEPLTLANYRNLPLSNDGRPDTDKAVFLVKTRLAPGIDAKTALD